MDYKLKKIHKATMKLLEKTGIRLMHPEIIELVKKNGVKVSDDVAYFTEEQLMKWVNKAPEKFTLYARNSEYDMTIGGDEVEYCTGYGCTAIASPDGTKREAKLEDYKSFIKLIHQSEYFNLNGGLPVQPVDLGANECNCIMMYATMKYSDKCIMGIPGDAKSTNRIMDMAGILFGGKDKLKEKSRVITLISTTSPLQIDRNALETMLVCVRNNQPIIITPGPISGSTGPITLSGNIVLGNAETLVGIAVSQMIREGIPVVYGLLPTTTYMKTGDISIGSPGFAIQSKYSSKLAKMYGLPNRSGGAVSDAKGVCVQSGYESMLSMFACRKEGSNLVIHSAGILDAFGAMSYEQFIIDLEIISMVDYYFDDINVDDDSLAIDLLHEVGHGGQFITSEHTYIRCRTEPWNPTISMRGHLQDITPSEKIISNAKQTKDKMINNYQQPNLDINIEEEIKNYLLSLNIDKQLVEKV